MVHVLAGEGIGAGVARLVLSVVGARGYDLLGNQGHLGWRLSAPVASVGHKFWWTTPNGILRVVVEFPQDIKPVVEEKSLLLNNRII
jgi:hypothetical protein